MSQPPPTVEEFKVLKPQFAAVDEAVVQFYLDLSVEAAPDRFTPAVYKAAVMALACHFMTLEGLGTDADSEAFADGKQDMQSIKTGTVTLTKFRREAGASTYKGWLNQTKCGATYYMWLASVVGGPRVAMGGVATRVSSYAKDHPFHGWV